MNTTIQRILRGAAFRNEEIAERGRTTVAQLRNWTYGNSQPSADALRDLAQGLISKANQLQLLASELQMLSAQRAAVVTPIEERLALVDAFFRDKQLVATDDEKLEMGTLLAELVEQRRLLQGEPARAESQKTAKRRARRK